MTEQRTTASDSRKRGWRGAASVKRRRSATEANEYQPDAWAGFRGYVPGPCFDILYYKLYRWPGHGVADHLIYQMNEAEYVTGDEYPQLTADPSGFFLTNYFPRALGALEPFQKLPALPPVQEIVFTAAALAPCALPEVEEALHKLVQAGKEAARWSEAFMALVVDVLAGVLTGSDLGAHLASVHDLSSRASVGFVMQALDVTAFAEWAEYEKHVQSLIGDIRNSPRAEGVDRIYLPGEIEWLKWRERKQSGIPVPITTLEQIHNLASELGVTVDLPLL